MNYDEARKHGKYAYQHLDCYYDWVDRDKAEEILKGRPNGSFLVRDSSIKGGTYLAISSVSQGKVSHELICLRYGYPHQMDERATFVSNIVDFLTKDRSKTLKHPVTHQELSAEKSGKSEKVVKAATAAILSDKLPKEIGEHVGLFVGPKAAKALASVNKDSAKAAKSAAEEFDRKGKKR